MPNKTRLNSGVEHGDARTLSLKLPSNSIDVTITSPPYFDLKNYGVKGQIGFGQTYEAYLSDLRSVFKNIYKATKPMGSLWIIIDTFRKEQEVVPLPFDLTKELSKDGWKLRDIVIWKKDRTVPWAHSGATRRIFEYLLVFAKTNGKYRYYSDRLRDPSDLKRWWVRYPERYNPSGKGLDEIWEFDIPTQGSWGDQYIQHFCPLPASLVSRIVRLTTDKSDLVFDPFSGSGTVLTQAALLGRKYSGFELNHTYIRKFKAHLEKQMSQQRDVLRANTSVSKANFSETIIDLRTLKYARLLLKEIQNTPSGRAITRIVVRKKSMPKAKLPKHKIASAEYTLIGSWRSAASLVSTAKKLGEVKPLSKFGIHAYIGTAKDTTELLRSFGARTIYAYSSTNTHSFKAKYSRLKDADARHPILSSIAVSAEIPDE